MLLIKGTSLQVMPSLRSADFLLESGDKNIPKS